MDLRIVTDTAERFAVQGSHAQGGEESVVTAVFVGVLLFTAMEVYQHRQFRVVGWVVAAGASVVYLWFMASFWTTGGIRFDVDIDRARGVWTTEAVYPKESGEDRFFHEPVTRALGDVLRVDMVASPGKGGNMVGNQRILITLKNGTSFEPFEGEDHGAENAFLVLDRLQKMLVAP